VLQTTALKTYKSRLMLLRVISPKDMKPQQKTCALNVGEIFTGIRHEVRYAAERWSTKTDEDVINLKHIKQTSKPRGTKDA